MLLSHNVVPLSEEDSLASSSVSRIARRVALAVFTTVVAVPAAHAAPITVGFASNAGDTVCLGEPSVTCSASAVAITPHSVWGDVSDNAGLAAHAADWISYANTGVNGDVAPNVVGARTPGKETALLEETFQTNISGSQFNLWVLADDTADVFLLGPGGYSHTFFSALQNQIDPCAPGYNSTPVGCTEQSMGHVASFVLPTAGVYTLQIFAYQTNSDVFGVQYAGNYQIDGSRDVGTPVPEPASLTLLGSGLVGLAGFVRRRVRKA